MRIAIRFGYMVLQWFVRAICLPGAPGILKKHPGRSAGRIKSSIIHDAVWIKTVLNRLLTRKENPDEFSVSGDAIPG
jgi:hypothetical protein